MHDLRMVRDQLDALRDGMKRRGKLEQLAPLVERAVSLDEERRAGIQAVEERKAARNTMSLEVARRKKAGETVDDLLERSRATGDEIARLERELEQAQTALEGILLELPNLPLPDAPDGGEENNRVVREWGAPRAGGAVKPH